MSLLEIFSILVPALNYNSHSAEGKIAPQKSLEIP